MKHGTTIERFSIDLVQDLNTKGKISPTPISTTGAPWLEAALKMMVVSRGHTKSLQREGFRKPSHPPVILCQFFIYPVKKTISISLFWFIKVYKLPGRFHLFSSSTSWSTSLTISIIIFNCLGFVDHSFKKTSQELRTLSQLIVR